MDRATNVTVSSEAYVFRLRTLARMCPLPGFSPPPPGTNSLPSPCGKGAQNVSLAPSLATTLPLSFYLTFWAWSCVLPAVVRMFVSPPSWVET